MPITGVSGTVGHDQTITINGSGFGTKPIAKPMIWCDFENGTLNPDSSLSINTSWGQIQEFSRNTSDNLLLNKTANAKFTFGGSFFEPGFRLDKTSWSLAFMRLRRRYSFQITETSGIKIWRIWPPSGDNNFLSALSTVQSVCYNECEANGTCGPLTLDRFQGSPHPINQWHTDEFIWEYRTNGTGLWDYKRNGATQQRRTNISNGTNNQQQLYVDNFVAPQGFPANGSTVHVDGIYIDDSYARVIVGNASALSACTSKEMVIPTAWSDTQITGVVKNNAFANGASAWIYVIDSSDTASAGWSVTIGTGGSIVAATGSAGSIAATSAEALHLKLPARRRMIQ